MTNELATKKDGRKRGRLKIFLGYAAGVGKTYTMLAEAHRRAKRGEDIVIGFLEPHKRPETSALAEGLESVPVKTVEYRGSTLREMDTQAVIDRNPQWVLVDELAHTNAPGSRNEKRWQDVNEIRDAGINVISTVNVQHFESLNDVVRQITGVTVRETLPDSILDDAEEVMVDITPEALQNRLERGVIYPRERVDKALSNFFRRGNLVALRELALRTTAEEVDDDLKEFFRSHTVDKTWGVTESVLVLVTPQKSSSKLIRRGYRMAERMNAEVWVLHVRTPGVRMGKIEEKILEDLARLTEDLGGVFIDQPGDDISREVVDFVGQHQVSFIVLGQSEHGRRYEIFKGSLVNRIMRETRNVDVVVVAHPDNRPEVDMLEE